MPQAGNPQPLSAAAAQTLDQRRTAPRLPAYRPRPRWASSLAAPPDHPRGEPVPLNRPAILNRVSAAAAQTLDRRTAPRLPGTSPQASMGVQRAHHTHHKGGSVHSAPPGQPFISRPLAPGLLPPFAPPSEPSSRPSPSPTALCSTSDCMAPQLPHHGRSHDADAQRSVLVSGLLGGGGERATSGGWSRALPSKAWGVHLSRS